MSNAELVRAYRQLYRSALRAIQFAKPGRYVLRDQLRAAFRGQRTTLTAPPPQQPTVFDAEAVRRTVWFFNAAAASTGIEHRIVRNLLMTAYWRRRNAEAQQPSWTVVQQQLAAKKKKKKKEDAIREHAFDSYDRTVQQLNETMGLCLR